MKDEWVLIVDAEFGPDLEVLSGRVAAHGPDKSEMWDRAIELRPTSMTVEYTGELKFDGYDCISVWFDDDLVPSALQPAAPGPTP